MVPPQIEVGVRWEAVGGVRLELDAEAIQRHRDDVVRADGEDGVHQLLHRVALGEGVPGGVADEGVVVQLIGGAQQAGLERVPALVVGTRCDTADFLVAEADRAPVSGVLGELVLRPAVPAGAQDQQLALARGQRRVAHDVRRERLSRTGEVGMLRGGALDVERRAA